jgi:hypothetical protein
MKLFFTIFGAILAAAAVIWLVSDVRQSRRESEALSRQVDSIIERGRASEVYGIPTPFPSMPPRRKFGDPP